MSIREQLRRRADVPNERIDDVIERASALQDEDVRASEGASIEDVERVAAELDIDPRYVEEALAQLDAEEVKAAEDALRQRALDEAEAAASVAGRKRMLGIALAVLLTLGAGVGGLGLVGAGQLSSAASEVQTTEAALDAVLDRQAALLPQLMALIGAELDSSALNEASDIDGRLQASQELSVEAAKLLAAAPAPANDADAQTRLNLQYELTGTQNRISTEQRRYSEAMSAYEAQSDSLAPSVAITLGFAAP